MSRKQSPSLASRIQGFFLQNPFPGDMLLVAVSGGQDSVCLLHALTGLELKLHVAHLNHQLRGEQSNRDAQYVFDLCHKLGLPVTIGQADVKEYQKSHKLSLEEAAREVRYRFLSETARAVGAKTVAIAHTRDDNVETILLHILRGSGTRGLIGLQPLTTRQIDGKKLIVIRPLLDISRQETGAYCRVHRLQPRLDASNFSLEPLRNRVRLELIPLLKTYNTGINEALLRASRLAADDIAFLETTARNTWRRVVKYKTGEILFDRGKITALPVSLQRSLLRMAVEKLTGTLKDVESRHLEEMLALIEKPAGKSIDLPYGLKFTADYDKFILSPNLSGAVKQGIGKEYPINLPGTTIIPGWEIRAKFIKPRKNNPDDVFTSFLDADVAGKKLFIRPRKTGDRFRPLGMNGLKKVSDFMLDARVPVQDRSRVPLVVSDKQVLWLVGYRIDDRVKVTNNTKRVLHLIFRSTHQD